MARYNRGMMHPLTNPRRRAVLLTAAGVVASLARPRPASARPPGQGKPGDFDFLAGQWKIHHRRLKTDKTWDEFDGEATCWTILGGTGSVEELRIPARDFSGMGLRLLNPKSLVWDDYWVNGKERGIDGSPGLTGTFENGVGMFTATDSDNRAVVYRGVWDRITPSSHRWRQGVSRDGGTTWDESWFMDWVRA